MLAHTPFTERVDDVLIARAVAIGQRWISTLFVTGYGTADPRLRARARQPAPLPRRGRRGAVRHRPRQRRPAARREPRRARPARRGGPRRTRPDRRDHRPVAATATAPRASRPSWPGRRPPPSTTCPSGSRPRASCPRKTWRPCDPRPAPRVRPPDGPRRRPRPLPQAVRRRRDRPRLLRRQLARAAAGVGDRARRAVPARGLGRSAHPRVGRVVDAAALRDRRPHRPRGRSRRRPGRRSSATPRPCCSTSSPAPRSTRSSPATRRGARSWSTATTSPPTATCSRASPASAACGCAGSRSTPRSGVTPEQLAEAVGPETALVVVSHVAYRSAYLAEAHELTRIAHDAGALDPLGPLPLGGIGARAWPTSGASTSPSAAPTSTSTADRAPPRSPTCATTCRAC